MQVVVAAASEFADLAARSFHYVDWGFAFVLAGDVNMLRVSRPSKAIHPAVKVFCDVLQRLCIAVVEDEAKAVRFEPRAQLAAKCDVLSVGRIRGIRIAARAGANLLG